jgi:hypothetical protein
MNSSVSVLSAKIAATAAAARSGLLSNYAPAKPANGDEGKVQASWGPAMRV